MLQCKNSQHTAFQQETSIVHADRLERTVRHESVGSDLANVCDVNSRRAREVAREHCRKRSLWTAKLILHGCEERWDDQRREARLAGSVPWRLCGNALRTVHRSGFSNSELSGCLQNAYQSLSMYIALGEIYDIPPIHFHRSFCLLVTTGHKFSQALNDKSVVPVQCIPKDEKPHRSISSSIAQNLRGCSHDVRFQPFQHVHLYGCQLHDGHRLEGLAEHMESSFGRARCSCSLDRRQCFVSHGVFTQNQLHVV